MTRHILLIACLATTLNGPGVLKVRAVNGQPQRPDAIPAFADLLAQPVKLKPELEGVHPRVFVTTAEIAALRARARTSHKDQWQKVLASLPAMKGDPPPSPGPQERRSQNNVAFAIAGASLAAVVEQNPKFLAAAKKWTLAAIDYEPWGYTYNKPNVDLAAGHLLYAIGWAYDLLYHEFTAAERARIRTSLERHASLVYDYFAPARNKRFNFTQNHDFIPTSGLAVTALALLGESPDAPKWAALARAHHHRAGQLLSPDGYYYEGMEYWIFSAPWLVHFLDAWEHTTGENLWDRDLFRNWKFYLAHVLLPDGQSVFDFGDIWEGSLTRAKGGEEYGRVYPDGRLQSNFNLMYRVAARLRDPQSQAIAERYAAFGHSNLEEYWTLIWRDPAQTAGAMTTIPLSHHFEDSGVVFARTSWNADATAFAFKCGPPEGHRVSALLPQIPEWRLSSGHAHPDANSFIIWADGRYLTGDTGYAGLPSARHHNTVTVGGVGQGIEGEQDVWSGMDARTVDATQLSAVSLGGSRVRLVGEAASSYHPKAGVKRFTRTFTFQAPNRFAVSDIIETAAPQTVEWFLHSDRPIAKQGNRYRLGGNDVSLDVVVTTPPTTDERVGPTFVTAPGDPGSIEQGRKDQRGYELVVRTPAATETRIDATLVVTKQARASPKPQASSPTPQAPSPFAALLEQPLPLKPGYGGHPRLFFDRQGLDALREKANRHPAEWQAFVKQSWALNSQPPGPVVDERGLHYRVGLALPEAAFAFAVDRSPAHLARARSWIDAVLGYEPWGYTFSKPNEDIPAGFLLYGLTFAYDLLASDLSPAERARIEAKIVEKTRRLFESYKPAPKKRYSFSQNHTFINAAAIGFAGLVLGGDAPSSRLATGEARVWIAFARAIFDSVVRTYSPDGYYYEGYHYFEFSVPWIVHFLDAMEQATGEDWYSRIRFDLAKHYVAHSLVPTSTADKPGLFFDFGDAGRGAADRLRGEQELLGAHNILYRFAARYHDPLSSTVAEWVRTSMNLPWREPLWTFVWRDPDMTARTMDNLPRFHHFENADVVFSRTSWNPDAVAFAFRCGPPEGHHAADLLRRLPEWRLSTGHAHPDAGSFIIIANGRYLTGDTGYTGVKMTADHNTLLIDGRGQENDGRHEVFRDLPYDRLTKIRVISATVNDGIVEIVADGTAAYPADLGLKSWTRTFRFDGRSAFVVRDDIRTTQPRKASVLLHVDRELIRRDDRTYLTSVDGTTLEVRTTPLAASIEPHIVVTQGRPGSVEQGEREQRGQRLTLTTAPQVESRIEMTLRVTASPRPVTEFPSLFAQLRFRKGV
jgi:Heparinase II/III-like protein/Domain of unknown function (DUF4962)